MNTVWEVLLVLFVLGCFGFFDSVRNFLNGLLRWRRKEVESRHKAMLKAKEMDLRIAEERRKAAELEIEAYERRRLQLPPDDREV